MNADELCQRLASYYIDGKPWTWRNPITGENTVVELTLPLLYRLFYCVVAEHGYQPEGL